MTTKKDESTPSSYRFSITDLRTRLKEWSKDCLFPMNLGPVSYGLLADYVNHAYALRPHYKSLLPVSTGYQRPSPKPTHDEAAPPGQVEPLLDTVMIRDCRHHIVSSRSLLRYAVSLGFTPQNAPKFRALFEGIFESLPRKREPRGLGPQVVGDNLVFLGRAKISHGGKGRDWGMPPSAFIEYIKDLDAAEKPQHNKAYGNLAREVISRYLKDLEQLRQDNMKKEKN